MPNTKVKRVGNNRGPRLAQVAANQDARNAMPTPLQKREQRRCLGPQESEHYFLSTGPDNRICPLCRARLANQHVAVIELNIVCSPPDA